MVINKDIGNPCSLISHRLLKKEVSKCLITINQGIRCDLSVEEVSVKCRQFNRLNDEIKKSQISEPFFAFQ